MRFRGAISGVGRGVSDAFGQNGARNDSRGCKRTSSAVARKKSSTEENFAGEGAGKLN